MARTKTLSTRFFKTYRVILFISITTFPLLYFTQALFALNRSGWFMSFIFIVAAVAFVLSQWRRQKEMLGAFREVSYDESNLYVKNGDHEIQVPFEKVKDIELVSLDGLYKFELFQDDQFGRYVLCKPSMWYPFNFPKVDKELNRIRKMIWDTKQRVWNTDQSNALTSGNIREV